MSSYLEPNCSCIAYVPVCHLDDIKVVTPSFYILENSY